jgi:hypothetical protein
VAHRNENILQCAPFVLALAVSAPLAARGSFCATRFTLAICASGLVASALGLILKLVPGFIQDNVLIIAIALPVWAGATLGSYWLRQAAAKAKDHAGQHSATRPEPVLDS